MPGRNPEDVIDKVLIAWLVCLVCAGVLIAALVGLGGCATTTAADIEKVASSRSAVTALKIAACVQGAMAEEQLELLRERREQEAAAEIEADRIRSEMHAPSSISKEVDKIVRPDAGVM